MFTILRPGGYRIATPLLSLFPEAAVPKKENYPTYMAPDLENYRAINAERLLDEKSDLTIDRLIKEVGYSHHLSAFEVLLPQLFIAFDELSGTDSLKQILSEPIDLLKAWDKNSSASSSRNHNSY